MKICNTTVEVKKKFFNIFSDMIGNQFMHGGDKYKLPGFDDREATDVISAVFGGKDQIDWVLGTILKYIFRFKNFHREKDLLKIATYCFILWLKCGFHLEEIHDEDVAKGEGAAKKERDSVVGDNDHLIGISGSVEPLSSSGDILVRRAANELDRKNT